MRESSARGSHDDSRRDGAHRRRRGTVHDALVRPAAGEDSQAGRRDLSYSMLLLYLLGLALWLVYGLRIQAIEVIAANVVGGTLVVAAIAMKRRSQQQDANGGRPCPRS